MQGSLRGCQSSKRLDLVWKFWPHFIVLSRQHSICQDQMPRIWSNTLCMDPYNKYNMRAMFWQDCWQQPCICLPYIGSSMTTFLQAFHYRGPPRQDQNSYADLREAVTILWAGALTVCLGLSEVHGLDIRIDMGLSCCCQPANVSLRDPPKTSLDSVYWDQTILSTELSIYPRNFLTETNICLLGHSVTISRCLAFNLTL